MNIGLIGGIVGGAIGVLGGIIGTWFSIKKTNSSRERKLVIKASAIIWVELIFCTGLMFLLPKPYMSLAFLPVWISLPFAIKYWNKKQFEIRKKNAEPIN